MREVQDGKAPYCLLVMVGIPGIGKSTLAKQIADLAAIKYGLHNLHVDFDSYIEDVGQFSVEGYRDGRRRALEDILANSKEHSLIIADDTFHLYSMRHACRSLARKYGAAYIQLVFPKTEQMLQLAIDQNARRASKTPVEVIQKTYQSYQPPKDRGWDASCSIYVSPNNKTIEEIWQDVMVKWEGPVPPLYDHDTHAEDRKATQHSIAHQVDIECRKYISEILSNRPSLGRQQLDHLNKVRKEIVKEAKEDTSSSGLSIVNTDQFDHDLEDAKRYWLHVFIGRI